MDLKVLNNAQRRILTHICHRIEQCEQGIPPEFWCSTCRNRIRKIKKLEELFYQRRKALEVKSNKVYGKVVDSNPDKYWNNSTDGPNWSLRIPDPGSYYDTTI